MLSTFFDTDFFQNLFSNALATLAGVFLALLLDRWVYKKQEEKVQTEQKKISDKRKNEFLQMTWLMLQRNSDILDHIISSGFKVTNAIVLNVDAQYFEVTASLKYEILDDLSLNGHLDMVRADLRQVHDLISLQLETGYSLKQEGNIAGFISDRAVLMDEISKKIALAQKHLLFVISKVLSSIDELKTKGNT